MIFQDPMTSLNPVKSIGRQLERGGPAPPRRLEEGSDATARVEALKAVGIPRADRRIDDYPHQFSGGMRQRVMIAMALINEPDLLIADEPTTALDVTTQAQILELMRQLQEEHGTAIIMITHDLGVVAEVADDVVVMYAGRVVEEAPVDEIFTRAAPPVHLGAARLAAAARRRRRAARADPGPAAVAAEPAARLPLQPALPVHDGSSAASRCRSCCAVPHSAAHRDACFLDEATKVTRARTPARGHAGRRRR